MTGHNGIVGRCQSRIRTLWAQSSGKMNTSDILYFTISLSSLSVLRRSLLI